MESTEKTLGEKRVRTSFNVAEGQSHSAVDTLKNKFAELIDFVELIKDKDPRLAATAQTRIEEAAMWAVKLATA